MSLPHLESFVGVFFEGLKTPQKTLDRLLGIATAKGVEMILVVGTLAERGFPQHDLLGDGYIYVLLS